MGKDLIDDPKVSCLYRRFKIKLRTAPNEETKQKKPKLTDSYEQLQSKLQHYSWTLRVNY